jgi:hypothetical protein
VKRNRLLLLALVFGLVAARWFYVPLRTGSAPEAGSCGVYVNEYTGELVEDLLAGTAWKVGNRTIPLTWPPGYTARHSGLNVEVLGPAGSVVAVTGRMYSISATSSTKWATPGCFREQ